MRKQGQRGLERVTTYYDLPQPPQPPQLIPPYPAPYAPVTHPSSLNPPTLLPPLPPLLACTQTYFPTLLHVLLPTTRISFQSYMTRVQLPPVIQDQGSAASSHTGPGFSCIQSYRTRVQLHPVIQDQGHPHQQNKGSAARNRAHPHQPSLPCPVVLHVQHHRIPYSAYPPAHVCT